MLEILKDSTVRSSPIFVLLLVFGYFGKTYVENKMATEFDVMSSQISAISNSSLNIKESLRGKELNTLLEMRENIEGWQDFLQVSLTNFSNNNITTDSINEFYEEEAKLQLKVKKSIAKLGILTRNEDLYTDGLTVLIDISKLYKGYIGKYLPQLIDLQAEREPIEIRGKAIMKRFESELAPNPKMDKMILEQAKKDQILSRDINARLVKLMREASDELLIASPKIVNLLTDLKVKMNSHVYRPLVSDQINKP